MCVALPARVAAVAAGQATVVIEGRQRLVNILPVPDVQAGDYVLVNLGVAVAKLTAEEVQEVTTIQELIGRLRHE